MALIKCNNCGKDVSSNAETCIHCGNRIERENVRNTIDNTTKRITENTISKLRIISSIMIAIGVIFGIIVIISAFATEMYSNIITGLCIMLVLYIVSVLFDSIAIIIVNLYQLNQKN